MHLLMPKDNTWKKFLRDEVMDEFSIKKSQITSPDGLPILEIDEKTPLRKSYLGLALDILPETQTIPAGSIGEQSSLIVNLLKKSNISQTAYQVFSISNKYGVVTSGRSELLSQKLAKNLRKEGIKRGKFHFKDCPLIKACIYPDRSIKISILDKVKRQEYDHLLSPFPGGYTTITDDKQAPSRAFKKLVEAQLVLGNEIKEDETLVDLGACPGGWSYVALNQGAQVTSIDRSPLREDLMPKVNFSAEDAFKFMTEDGFDWVVSDIICTPDRILELIETWATPQKCKNFVFTIKFKGSDSYDILQSFKKKLHSLDYDCILRQLNVNKNEVMVMGTRI
ncbi:hypothetical protein DAY19_07840 [Halobacteriovorax vibrionivorans]|uniref:Ribosomal RNA methyltransferase FtsJ domain-containing protein n=1 Tax=Halobacteriovorax vibrionivorans TaxID=2152716 RepID=A0ABY0IGG5_9BACT|nr:MULTISPECIES: SAM-dependent methyltransferase [Halobacteriovorax]RZF21590.1 hypothetical protein DAY19_07840 [Halobacteriovorax vibrionivorans]TGD49117.1 hypothetical protein EP118_01210 [Halobacteriovorax sp. Y22]